MVGVRVRATEASWVLADDPSAIAAGPVTGKIPVTTAASPVTGPTGTGTAGWATGCDSASASGMGSRQPRVCCCAVATAMSGLFAPVEQGNSSDRLQL